MSRSRFLLGLAGALLLVAPSASLAQKKPSVCPFLASLQIQQMQQMQRQIQQQQSLVTRQQQAMPPRMSNSGSRSVTPGNTTPPSRSSTTNSSRVQPPGITRQTPGVSRPALNIPSRTTTTDTRAWHDAGRIQPIGEGHRPWWLEWELSGRTTQAQSRVNVQRAPRVDLRPTNQNIGRPARQDERVQNTVSRPVQNPGRETNQVQRAVNQPPRPAPQNSRVTSRTPQHSSRTQARITVNMSCGVCHQGDMPKAVQQNPADLPRPVGGPKMDKPVGRDNPMPKPVVKNNPPMPKQVGPRNKDLQRPWRKPDDLGPLVWRPFPGPGFPVEVPRAPLDRAVLRPQPGPAPVLGKRGDQPILPVVPQPQPPLGFVRPDPGQPLPEWVAPFRPDGMVQPKSPLDPATPLQPVVSDTSSALQGVAREINPALLEETKPAPEDNGQDSYGELLPSDIVLTGPPPPAPGKQLHDRGLLPALNQPNVTPGAS